MFNVKKLGEDVWVACEGDRGDYFSEYHVPDYEPDCEHADDDDEEGLPTDLGMSEEEWDALERKLEDDAISWWV